MERHLEVLKQNLQRKPEFNRKSFVVPDKILNNWRSLKTKGKKNRENWEIRLKKFTPSKRSS